jgi:hypothetical protein
MSRNYTTLVNLVKCEMTKEGCVNMVTGEDDMLEREGWRSPEPDPLVINGAGNRGLTGGQRGGVASWHP